MEVVAPEEIPVSFDGNYFPYGSARLLVVEGMYLNMN